MLKRLMLLAPSILFSQQVTADGSFLWVGYNQNKTEFFVDGGAQIKPDGVMLGLSTELSENIQLTLSYSDLKGKISETIFLTNQISFVNTGDTEASSSGLSLSWLGDDYGITISYGQIDNSENSTTRFPLTVEEIIGDDQVFSISYDRIISTEDLNIGWSIGSQYAISEVTLIDIIGTDPITEINAEFDTESWSAYLDFDFSYPLEYENFKITPLLILSWNWELSTSGDELLTVFRNGERFRVNALSDRLATTFRTPDSGFWEMAVEFQWSENWGATLAYGQSIAADTDIDSISFDISVAF